MLAHSLVGLLALTLAGCDASPVVWAEPARLEDALARAPRDWRLWIGAGGEVRAVRSRDELAARAVGSCDSSYVTAGSGSHERFIAWWAARPDSSVVLRVRRALEGEPAAESAMTADARDHGRRGCARPAPSIAVDTAHGYVHLAYFLEPAEGAGVWLVHYMERDAMWHAPTPLGFGADPVSARLAAQAGVVAVAFESPNANEGWITLALSTSDGHLIDWTLPAVSGRSVPAIDPRVALDGRRVAVAWTTRTGGLTMVRTGTLRGP